MTKFDKQCLLEVALYILNVTKGTDLYHLLKILYFAEQKHLVKWGGRITSDDFRAYDYGPVADNLYHAIRSNNKLDVELTEMLHDVVSFAGDDAPNILLANREADVNYLSKSEIECLDDAIRENANLSFNELKEKSHDSAWHKAYHHKSDIMDSLSIAEAAGATDTMLEYIKEQNEIDAALV